MHEFRKEQLQTTSRKRRRLAAILLPAALLGVAAAGYVVLRSDEVVAAGIGCYDAPNDTDSNVAVVSTTGEDPVRVCKELWERGDIGSSSGQVPAMTACINSGGAIAVFPTGDVDICTRLGLQDLPEGYQAAARRFVRMRDALIVEMYEAATAGPATERNACLSQERALEIAGEVLSEHGFDDWTAEIHPGDYEGRTCGNAVVFDDRAKKVLIIPSDLGIDPNPFGPH